MTACCVSFTRAASPRASSRRLAWRPFSSAPGYSAVSLCASSSPGISMDRCSPGSPPSTQRVGVWPSSRPISTFDWSHEVVVLGGVTTTVKVAHLRLCHSRMFLVRAYPRESQEMVFDAHEHAFRLFGGSCRRGIYDNMRTAVAAILAGRQRTFNRRFQQFCSHHLVEPTPCNPCARWAQ